MDILAGSNTMHQQSTSASMTPGHSYQYGTIKFFRLPTPCTTTRHASQIRKYVFIRYYSKKSQNHFYCELQSEHSTSTSLINVRSRLIISMFFSTLHAHFHSPHLLISQIFFTLHSSFIVVMYVLVFSKKSHPPRLLILQLLHPLHVYSNLLGYQRESNLF